MSNIARRLIEKQLVQEGQPIQAARGKPRVPLIIDGSGGYALGVHVDPARLTVVLLDIAGKIRGYTQLRTPKARYPKRVIDLIASTAENLVQRADVDPSRVLGLGVAAPGPIDVTGGVVLDPPQLPNWRNVRLRADLHASTGWPVLLDKDVTAAVTGELRASPASSHNFVFLYLGCGVGAGVVLGDEVIRGASNNLGEVGEILVDPHADDLGWGRRGSLATACIPEALVVQAERQGLLAAPPYEDYGAVDDAFTALCEMAYGGNQRASALIDHSAKGVATGLAVIVNLLDVDRVVLGGPMWSRVSARYLALLPELLAAELIAARRPVPVEGSAVGEHVAAQGAAGLVLDHFLAPRPSVLLME
jgi:predicted NBD/HSP70 family sugar kinase